MALQHKPKRKPVQKLNEDQIAGFIQRGGEPPQVEKSEQSDSQKKKQGSGHRKYIQLRIEEKMLQMIDEARELHVVKPSRHHWILEAIVEKLDNSK